MFSLTHGLMKGFAWGTRFLEHEAHPWERSVKLGRTSWNNLWRSTHESFLIGW